MVKRKNELAKSNMTNLDSMQLSKIPYMLRANSSGYSHSVQSYTILNKNIKDILCFKKKKKTLFYIHKKGLADFDNVHVGVKKESTFKKTLRYRESALTIKVVNNIHLVNHTLISPQPYMSGRKAKVISSLGNQINLTKRYTKVRKALTYRNLILKNCVKNFLNHIE